MMETLPADLFSLNGTSLGQNDKDVMCDFLHAIGTHRVQGTEAIKSFLARLKQLGISEGPGSSSERTEQNYWRKIYASVWAIRLLRDSPWRQSFIDLIKETEHKSIYECKRWYSEKHDQIRIWLEQSRALALISKHTSKSGLATVTDLSLVNMRGRGSRSGSRWDPMKASRDLLRRSDHESAEMWRESDVSRQSMMFRIEPRLPVSNPVKRCVFPPLSLHGPLLDLGISTAE